MQFPTNDSAVLHAVSMCSIVYLFDAGTAQITVFHYDTLTRDLIIQAGTIPDLECRWCIFSDEKEATSVASFLLRLLDDQIVFDSLYAFDTTRNTGCFRNVLCLFDEAAQLDCAFKGFDIDLCGF